MDLLGIRVYGLFVQSGSTYIKRKLCIPSIINNSEFIYLLKENMDKENNDVVLDLKDICQYDDLIVLEEYISNISTIQYKISLDINYHSENLIKIMNYLIICDEVKTVIKRYIDMAKNIVWSDMVDSKDLKEYFYDILLSKTNRREVSFYLFFNTYLKYRHEIPMEELWIFIRVFNMYVENMENLNVPLPREYHLINVYELFDNYDESTVHYIKTVIFPESIYSFYEKDYSFLAKMADLLELDNKFDRDEFVKFIMTFPDIENIYFAGSSFLYFILNNFDVKINDIDIWMNLDENPTSYFCSQFFKKTINSLDVDDFQGKIRGGILDIVRRKGSNIQFIHLEDSDGYDVIQTFDFPFLTGYFCIKNGKEELYMTTHCIESNFSKKMFGLYNLKQNKNTLNFTRRLHKYHSRGFEFVGKFKELIEKIKDGDIAIENDDSLNSFDLLDLDKFFKLYKRPRVHNEHYEKIIQLIPDSQLNKISSQYFYINMNLYTNSDDYIYSHENHSLNYITFNTYLKDALNPHLNTYYLHIYKTMIDIRDKSKFNLFSKLIFIDEDTGESINDCIHSEDLFDGEAFVKKYDIHSCYQHINKLFFRKNDIVLEE